VENQHREQASLLETEASVEDAGVSNEIASGAAPVATLGITGVTMDTVGLVVTKEISYDDWESVGAFLGALRDLSAWSLGDWIVVGEKLYEERVAQGIEVTGRSKATLLEYARVARKVPRKRRNPDLHFTHHQLVAGKDPEEQAMWLDRAVANDWSIEEFRGMLRDPNAPRTVRRRRRRFRRSTVDVHSGSHNPALPARQNDSPSEVEVLELVEDVARQVLRAAEPLQDGYVRVPEHVLDRLANALGVGRP
jgi:hypothetical protein